MWARRRFAPDLSRALTTEPAQMPLLVPGRAAVECSSAAPLVLVLHGVGADETQLAPYILTDRSCARRRSNVGDEGLFAHR